MKYIPKTVEVEVGYLLLKSAWGRGFATEGAAALLAYGFDVSYFMAERCDFVKPKA